MHLAKGLLCGEKSTLAILLGSNTLWGERYFAEMLMVTLMGIPLMLEGINRLHWGIRRTLPRTIFPWLLAEDNPVISW